MPCSSWRKGNAQMQNRQTPTLYHCYPLENLTRVFCNEQFKVEMSLPVTVLFLNASQPKLLSSDYRTALKYLHLIKKKKCILELGTRRALKPKCCSGQEPLEIIRHQRYKQKPLEVAAYAVVPTHDCNWKIRNYDDECSNVYRFH